MILCKSVKNDLKIYLKYKKKIQIEEIVSVPTKKKIIIKKEKKLVPKKLKIYITVCVLKRRIFGSKKIKLCIASENSSSYRIKINVQPSENNLLTKK